jgi:hypothetical protein
MKIRREDVFETSLLTPKTAPLKRKSSQISSRKKAADNRKGVLLALRSWGHLRCSDIGRIIWPNGKYPEQMAQRLVRRLAAKGEILQRRNGWGTPSWVLTRGGAAAVEAMGLKCVHGLDIGSVSGPTFAHRALGTRFGIEKSIQGYSAYGEHAIYHGHAPVRRDELIKRFGKLPDLLIFRENTPATARGPTNQEKIVWWCEVESAAKPLAELIRCVSIASFSGTEIALGTNIKLAGVIFIFDSNQGHAARIAKAARANWHNRSNSEIQAIGRRIVLASVDLVNLGGWQSYIEKYLGE